MILKKKRLKGENDDYLCGLIQNDSIESFIIYVNKNSLMLQSQIKESIFETNSFLLSKTPALIEYAAFHGSIQIFRYLFLNNAELPPSLWLYVVHGNDPEIINLLEEKNIKPDNFNDCYRESIKCHNNEVANYIQNNYLKETNIQLNLKCCLHYFNYDLIPIDKINELSFFYSCKYDHYSIVKCLLDTKWIDKNEVYVYNYDLFYIIENLII